MTELTCVVCLRNKNAAGGVAEAATIYNGNALCREHFDEVRKRRKPEFDIFQLLNEPGASRDW